MKTDTNEMGCMAKMVARPIYGKAFKNLFLQNKSTDDFEIWYVALGTTSSTKIIQTRLLG